MTQSNQAGTIVDSHAHLGWDSFAEDRDEVIARAFAAGVAQIVQAGVYLHGMEEMIAIAEAYTDIYCAVGLHPHEAKDYDLDALVALRKSDPRLAKLIDRVGAYAINEQTSRTTFEALARSIVYQQLSGKAAATIFGRVIDAIGGTLTPEAILKASDKTLRGAGLSRSKMLSVRDLAEKTIAGKIPSLSRLLKMDDEKIIETLTEVRGIGRWSVEMLLMFRLGRRDILPVSDYGIRKGIMLLHGLADLPSLDDVEKHGEKWRPHRTIASWYLWRSLDAPTS